MIGVKEVKIVSGKFLDEVEDEINGLLINGWELYGKLQITPGSRFVQMMLELKDPAGYAERNHRSTT